MSPIWVYSSLALAIAAEVIATTALARSDGLTRLGPSLVTVGGYALAFYLLTISLAVLPTGVVYALWSGLGIVLVTLVSWLGFGQRLDLPAIIGLGLILAGVVVLNLFSDTSPH